MKLKRILTLLLVWALCLSLAACTGSKNDGTGAGTNTNPGGTDPNATTAPETYVYTPSYTAVSSEIDGFIQRLYAAGDRFLISMYGLTGNNAPEGTPEEEVANYDQYGAIFYWLDLDGSVTKLENYKPIEAPMESSEDGKVNCSAYNQNFFLTADGTICSLDCVYISIYSGPDDPPMYSMEWWNLGYYDQYMEEEQHYYIRTLSQDGSELSRITLDAAAAAAEEAGSYFYVNNVCMDGAGNLYVLSDSMITKLDPSGARIKYNCFDHYENPDSYLYVESMFTVGDRILLSCYTDNGQVLAELDTETLMPDTENAKSVTNLWNTIPGNGDYDLFYTNGSNLMGFRLATGESEKVLNWINSDVNPNNANGACMLEDGRIALVESEWDKNYEHCTNTLITLKQVPASSVAKKTVLTFATQYLDYDMQNSIVKFNRTSPDFRVEVRDYSEYNTEEDYSAGLTKLTTEIMAGNVPDILDLNGLPYAKIASKGLLADLTPYLNSDAELQGKILPNVIEALSVGGKLYRTASGFNVMTVVGAASVVGDKPGWTLKDFKAALSAMPEGCTPFDESTTQDQILNTALSMEMNNLVDWNTGKCSFDTGLFADILEFAGMFPKEYDWDNYVWDENDNEMTRISEGRQMLMMQWFNDFESIIYINALFGGDATYIGYPTTDGVGAAMSFDGSGFAIGAKCPNKDIAWQFVRTMFTAEYQRENSWNFPTNTDVLQDRVKDITTPMYEVDDEGNYVLDKNGNKIERSRGTWGWGGHEVEIFAMTEEEAAEVVEMISSVNRIYNYDEELMNMVTTDAAAFFAGQKTSEQVAKQLQSKMTIYLGEQK